MCRKAQCNDEQEGREHLRRPDQCDEHGAVLGIQSPSHRPTHQRSDPLEDSEHSIGRGETRLRDQVGHECLHR